MIRKVGMGGGLACSVCVVSAGAQEPGKTSAKATNVEQIQALRERIRENAKPFPLLSLSAGGTNGREKFGLALPIFGTSDPDRQWLGYRTSVGLFTPEGLFEWQRRHPNRKPSPFASRLQYETGGTSDTVQTFKGNCLDLSNPSAFVFSFEGTEFGGGYPCGTPGTHLPKQPDLSLPGDVPLCGNPAPTPTVIGRRFPQQPLPYFTHRVSLLNGSGALQTGLNTPGNFVLAPAGQTPVSVSKP